MVHKLDIDPVVDWIRRTISEEMAKEVEAALPTLPIGEAFICSDALGVGGQRVKVRPRRTFNSGATPKVGEERIEPKMLAQVDVKKLGREIAASAERAIEESPEHLKSLVAQLRAKVAELQGKLDKKSPAKAPVTIDVPKKEVDMGFMEEAQAAHEELVRLREENARLPALEEQLAELPTLREEAARAAEQWRETEDQYREIVGRFEESFNVIMADFRALQGAAPRVLGGQTTPKQLHVAVAKPAAQAALPAPKPKAEEEESEPAGKSAAQSRILQSIVEFEVFGVSMCRVRGFRSGRSCGGGYYQRTLSAMTTAGLLVTGGGTVGLTEEGRRLAPAPERR